MISALVITYLFVWALAVLCGFCTFFHRPDPGFHHEYRVASSLNFALYLLTLLFLFTSICKTERVLRMMIWFLHFEFLAPVVTIWVYSISNVGNNSPVFYYFVTFIAVPLVFFFAITGISVGNFIFV